MRPVQQVRPKGCDGFRVGIDLGNPLALTPDHPQHVQAIVVVDIQQADAAAKGQNMFAELGGRFTRLSHNAARG